MTTSPDSDQDQSTTWKGDAVGLVEAYRSGDRSPVAEIKASLAAIDSSNLNAFSYIAAEQALEAAAKADVSLPFGGVPIGVKELSSVKGWPDTDASLVFKDRIASYDTLMNARIRDEGGAILLGLTTASEFGGLNVSKSRLNGATGNPWDITKTAGGSSAGSSAAVAGALVPIATGGDGGGSIRIPAGFCGLFGMKGTAGRIPRGPHTSIAPMTVVAGCQARSVRDAARWYDVCAGFDSRDPYSLAKEFHWEANLGNQELAGMRVAIVPSLGGAVVLEEIADRVSAAGLALAADAGLEVVDLSIEFPELGFSWAMANMASLYASLKDSYPACLDLMTSQIAFGLEVAVEKYDLEMAADAEQQRTRANELMADIFDQVDFVICATNPDVACPVDVNINTRVGSQKVPAGNNGALTIPANISGNPACSIPMGTVNGLPVGMQIIGRQQQDAYLFDLALKVEQTSPWPLTAPRPGSASR